MQKTNTIFIYLVILLFLGACQGEGVPTATPNPKSFGDQLQFITDLHIGLENNVTIKLGLENNSETRFPGDDEFTGRMEIRELDSQELRASAEVYSVSAIDPGEAFFPVTWEGQLFAGSYMLTWSSPDYDTQQIQFEIR